VLTSKILTLVRNKERILPTCVYGIPLAFVLKLTVPLLLGTGSSKQKHREY
jgi:hypothetical protein